MSTENKVATQRAQPPATQEEIITSLVLEGDLSKMTSVQKVEYYNSFCRALDLNPLTQPFEILNLKGKLRMYATKSCTEQLRRLNGVSVTDLTVNQVGDNYTVTAKGSDKTGRVDASMAVLSIKGLSGENLANAMMKCETKAKRRLTLSLCGLGILDETEVESIVNAQAETTTSNDAQQPNSTPDAPTGEELIKDSTMKQLGALLNDPALGEFLITDKLNVQLLKDKLNRMYTTKSLFEEKAQNAIKMLTWEIEQAKLKSNEKA